MVCLSSCLIVLHRGQARLLSGMFATTRRQEMVSNDTSEAKATAKWVVLDAVTEVPPACQLLTT